MGISWSKPLGDNGAGISTNSVKDFLSDPTNYNMMGLATNLTEQAINGAGINTDMGGDSAVMPESYNTYMRDMYQSGMSGADALQNYNGQIDPWLIGVPGQDTVNKPTNGSYNQMAALNGETTYSDPYNTVGSVQNINPNDLMYMQSGSNSLGSSPAMASAGGMSAASVDFSEGIQMLNEAMANTQSVAAVEDSYLADWTQLFGSPGTNMNDYFQNYKPEQLEAMGMSQIKSQFDVAAENAKAQLAKNGLSGSGIEKGVLNDVSISEAERLSQQRIANTNSYYDKLMQWNVFEAQSKMQLLGQKLQALGMSNDLSKTMAQLSSQEQSINAQFAQQAAMTNAQLQTQVSMTNANNMNSYQLAKAQLDQQAQQYNANIHNNALQYNADVNNKALFSNANVLNNTNVMNTQQGYNQLRDSTALRTGTNQQVIGDMLQKYGIDAGVASSQSDILGNILGTATGAIIPRLIPAAV